MSGVASNIERDGVSISLELFEQDRRDDLVEALHGTNINISSLLTTDYLNHFSAIYMILEMLPSDPKLFAADILGWEPRTYAEHLRESGFRDSELAILCYEYTDQDIRKAFDKIIAQLEDATKLIIERLEAAMEHDHLEQIQMICDDGIPQMRQLVEDAASVVNGDNELIAGICAAEEIPEEEVGTSSQADIDALFD